jgi:1-acyl-sn-glycerol-3-phosphate acyltransferase
MSLRDRIQAGVLKPVRAASALGWTVSMLGAVTVNEWVAGAERREAVFESYMRPWAELLTAMMGAQVLLSPAVPPPAQRARLIVSNHRSALDIGIMLTYFGGSIVSRADLEDWPLLGTCAKKAQTIFVDQDSRHSGMHAMKAIREQLQRGRTVCVFPEGTTFPGDEVRPFARGLFAAARGIDVEVIPVGLAYPPGCEYTENSFVDHLGSMASRVRTPVAVQIGQPQSLSGGAAKNAAAVHEEVQRLVHLARARLPDS